MISLFKGIGKKVDFIAMIFGKLLFYPLAILLILIILKPILIGFNTPEPIILVVSSIISLIRKKVATATFFVVYYSAAFSSAFTSSATGAAGISSLITISSLFKFAPISSLVLAALPTLSLR